VTTAAMIALASGRNVTILTRDQDILDQFYCLTGQLSHHYQATLFGDRYADDPAAFRAEPMPRSKETEAYFYVEESLVVNKPVPPERFTEWLLPAEYETIRMNCVLLTGPAETMAITPLIYLAEAGMYRLVE